MCIRYYYAEVRTPNQLEQIALCPATRLLQVSTLTGNGEDNQNLILFETAYIFIFFPKQPRRADREFHVLIPTEVMNISI